MSFSGFSASPHYQDHPAVVGRILDSGRFADISDRLETDRFLYLARFAGESPDNVAFLRL
jgi:hypothetical protein